MIDYIKNKTVFTNKYKTNSEAVIIACYFNPQNNPYRLKAFRTFYESIKHLNYQIVECVIGDSKPELVKEFPSLNITRVFTKNLLWHKETLLNKIINSLPKEYKYIFWVDADVIFTNKNWLVDGVKQLQTSNIIQPFEYCIHLDEDELKPNFDVEAVRYDCSGIYVRHKQMWRSFCANYVMYPTFANSENYDVHGHVGFAWAARREVFDKIKLYDKALIGGADHIIAHAAAGHIPHKCITKSFTENIDEVNEWSELFYKIVDSKIGYVKGDLYHIWHGDIEKRQYLKRIQDFTGKTKQIVKKDKNGLYITDSDDEYMKNYFKQREVSSNNLLTSLLVMDYLADDNETKQETLNTTELGGGQFGGAGSGGSWDDNKNENFS